MYHKIGIQRLSPSQISKLLNGHKIRVKHGQGHEIHASEEQHKKIMAAHRKGKAHTMQFDPFQIAQHQHLRHGSMHHGYGEGLVHHGSMHHGYGDGEGIFDTVGSVARAVAPTLIDYGADALKQRLGHGEGIKHRGRPRKHARKTPKHHASMGEGRAVGRRRRGHGEGEGVFGSVARAVAPIAIDYGARALKSRLGLGEGMHSRSRYSHKSHGEALYPAGYGEGEGSMYGHGVKRRGRKSRGEGELDFSVLDKRKKWDDYVKSHNTKGKGAIGSVLGSLAGNFLPF